MITIKKLELGYGAVTFTKEVEATPTTVHKDGNVTVKNMGSPGRPSNFEVNFMISGDVELSGADFYNIFHLKVVIPGLAKETPYAEVEAQAFAQLAPMLRAFAQKIEDDEKELAANDAPTT